MPTQRRRLRDLEPGANFIPRHIGPSDAEIGEMLKILGAASLEEFIERAVPKKIRSRRPLELPPVKSERAALSYLGPPTQKECYCVVTSAR